MFLEPGGKIKSVSKAIFIVGAILSILSGFVVFILLSPLFKESMALLVLAICGTVIGVSFLCYICWLISLVIYSWGEVVESVAYLSEQHADALEEHNQKLLNVNEKLLLEVQKINLNASSQTTPPETETM